MSLDNPEVVICFKNFFQGADGDLREVGCNNGNYAYYCQPVYSPRYKRLELFFTDTCELLSEDEFERVETYRNIGMRGVKKIVKDLARKEREAYEYQYEKYEKDE